MDNELGPSERLLLEAMQIEDSPRMADANRIRQRVLMGVGVAAAGAATSTAVEAAIGSSPLAAPAAALGLSASSTVTTATSGASVAAAGTAAAGGTAAAATSGIGFLKALLVVGGVAGLGGGAVALSWQHSEPTEHAPAATQVVPSRDSASTGQEAVPASKVPVAEEVAPKDLAPVEQTKRTVVPASGALAPSSEKKVGDSASTLKEEALLLSKAQAALQRGDTATAISVLSEHRKQFPSGVLSGEREAALAVAYCKSGNLAEGRAKAERFVARHPSSPMVQRLKTACKLTME